MSKQIDNTEWLDEALGVVYDAGFYQAQALYEGRGDNTESSDALYKAKQAILQHFQQEQDKKVLEARMQEVSGVVDLCRTGSSTEDILELTTDRYDMYVQADKELSKEEK